MQVATVLCLAVFAIGITVSMATTPKPGAKPTDKQVEAAYEACFTNALKHKNYLQDLCLTNVTSTLGIELGALSSSLLKALGEVNCVVGKAVDGAAAAIKGILGQVTSGLKDASGTIAKLLKPK